MVELTGFGILTWIQGYYYIITAYVTSVKVTNWPVYGYGTVSVPADYKVILEGNQEGISIGTVIDDDGNVTITAVPYL